MVATKCRNLLAAIDAARGGGLPPLFCPSQFAMPAKGVTFRYPPFALGWGRFKLPHRCDNLSHWCRVRNLRQWSRCPSGGQRGGRSAESCPNFGRAAAASSCPNLGQLPRVSCYKMLLRRGSNLPTPVPYAHRCTVSSYSSIGQGWICKHSAWISAQARRHRRC